MGEVPGISEIILEDDEGLSNSNVVAVRCSDGELRCWKSALVKASDYVRGLLDGNFMERNHRHVNLPHVSRDQLRKVVALHVQERSRKLSIVADVDEAWELAEIADMLGFAAGSAALDQYICDRVTTQNLDETYALADTFCRETVRRSVAREMALLRSTTNVQECSQFNCSKVDKPYREEITLRVRDSTTTDSRCESPIQHKTHQSPGQYNFTHRFYSIGGYAFRPIGDCHVVDCDDLVKFVEAEQPPENLDDYSSDSDFGSSSEGEEMSLNDIQQELGHFTNHVATFRPIATFPDQAVEDYTVAAVGTKIYVVGGFYYDKLLPSGATWRYDTRADEWLKMCDMKHKRMMHCTAVVDDRIYVCGGYDGELVHNTTEKYDTKRDVWIEEPKMPIGVGNAACASLRDSVYVVCGQFGSTSIRTTSQVQQYNTTTRQWTFPTEYVSPVFHPLSEYGMSCGAMGDILYVVGGQTVRVDCYNVKTGQWKRLSNMSNRRVGTYVTEYRGRLLAAGGYDYDYGTFFNTVEVYDPASDTWSMLSARLPEHSRNAGFCYVFDVER